VVVGEHGHRRVERAVGERQRLGARVDARGRVSRPLRARMTADGSTAVTSRSRGSYEPLPAPTLSTVRAPPSAPWITAAIRGSSPRVATYERPIRS
jgi:hypothetical protein